MVFLKCKFGGGVVKREEEVQKVSPWLCSTSPLHRERTGCPRGCCVLQSRWDAQGLGTHTEPALLPSVPEPPHPPCLSAPLTCSHRSSTVQMGGQLSTSAPLFLQAFRENPEGDIRGKGIRNRERRTVPETGEGRSDGSCLASVRISLWAPGEAFGW